MISPLYTKERMIDIPVYSFFVIFFVIYGAANLYIGWRGWQTLGQLLPDGSARLYWLTLTLFALSYFASRAGAKWLPETITTLLTYAGVFWMAVIYYGFLLALFADIIRLLDRIIPLLPMTLKQHPEWTGLTVVILLTCILAYGFWNARHSIINRYDITIAKNAGNRTNLHAVAVSDIHLGDIIGADRLEELVESINQLQPDIVLLPGDIIEAELQPFIAQNMGAVLRRLNPPLGVYAVLGNHEYIGGEQDGIIAALEQAGVKVLRDSKVIINDSLVVAGRDERSRNRYAGGSRAPLSSILAGTNPAMPVLLLDHQPLDLDESRLQGVDLQLSGHTHRGQLYPNHLITSAIFEIDWGYLKKDSLQVIVSCGYGTWGPPIRTGNQPELLDIHITFQGK